MSQNRTNSGKYDFLASQPEAGLKMEILKMPFLLPNEDFKLGDKVFIRYPKQEYGVRAMLAEKRKQAWVNQRGLVLARSVTVLRKPTQ